MQGPLDGIPGKNWGFSGFTLIHKNWKLSEKLTPKIPAFLMDSRKSDVCINWVIWIRSIFSFLLGQIKTMITTLAAWQRIFILTLKYSDNVYIKMVGYQPRVGPRDADVMFS